MRKEQRHDDKPLTTLAHLSRQLSAKLRNEYGIERTPDDINDALRIEGDTIAGATQMAFDFLDGRREPVFLLDAIAVVSDFTPEGGVSCVIIGGRDGSWHLRLHEVDDIGHDRRIATRFTRDGLQAAIDSLMFYRKFKAITEQLYWLTIEKIDAIILRPELEGAA